MDRVKDRTKFYALPKEKHVGMEAMNNALLKKNSDKVLSLFLANSSTYPCNLRTRIFYRPLSYVEVLWGDFLSALSL